MKKEIITGILIAFFTIFSINLIFADEPISGCPGAQYSPIMVNYSLSVPTNCIELSIMPSCGGTGTVLSLRNYKCSDIIVYTFQNGSSIEIYPNHDIKNISYKDSLPLCPNDIGQCTSTIKCSSFKKTIIPGYKCIDYPGNQVCCNITSSMIDTLTEYVNDYNIPQDVGKDWTRTFYFKKDPNKKIIISAKNIATNIKPPTPNPTPTPTPQKINNSMYYIIGIVVIILIIIILFWIFKRKK